MPSKDEDLSVWKSLLDLRNYLYHLIRKRLDVVVKSSQQQPGHATTPGSGGGGSEPPH